MLNIYNEPVIQVLIIICIILSFKSLPVSLMNMIRKLLGVCCILLAIVATCLFIKVAIDEMTLKNASTNLLTANRIQWTILIIIFLPIMVGLSIYGYRAFAGIFDDMENY
jgi:cytochrome bd-type quinol oxidase subunit 2